MTQLGDGSPFFQACLHHHLRCGISLASCLVISQSSHWKSMVNLSPNCFRCFCTFHESGPSQFLGWTPYSFFVSHCSLYISRLGTNALRSIGSVGATSRRSAVFKPWQHQFEDDWPGFWWSFNLKGHEHILPEFEFYNHGLSNKKHIDY